MEKKFIFILLFFLFVLPNIYAINSSYSNISFEKNNNYFLYNKNLINSSGISVVHYDYFYTFYPDFGIMPSGNYWYVSNMQYSNNFTGDRILEIVCSK